MKIFSAKYLKYLPVIFTLNLNAPYYSQTDTVKYQWPVQPLNESHTINGTFAEFRNTGTYDHFHNAVDIGEPDGNPVYACIDGEVYSIVTNSGSNNYVSVKSFINGAWKRITYLHISPNPSLYVGQAVHKGSTILGTIYSGMGHVHLIEREFVNNINDYAVEINNIRPEGGLTPYVDLYSPVIHTSSLKFVINGTDYELPPDGLSGKVDIIIKIEERNGTSTVNANNGTYIAGYRIWSEDTSQIIYEPDDGGVKYRFYRKPYNDDVHNVYVKGVATLSNPVYILTNGRGESYINNHQSVSDNYLNTAEIPEGNYYLEIFSEDTRNNVSKKFIPITITRRDVVPPGIPELMAIENVDGLKSCRVIYNNNSEPDVVGYRLYYTSNTLLKDWKLAADESVLRVDTTEHTFISPEEFAEPTTEDIYFFYLTAVDSAGNESEPSDIYARSTYSDINNYPNVLLVDGFDRYGGSGGWQFPTHSFTAKYFIALTLLDSSIVSSCSNEAVLKEEVKLGNYDWVIWYLGDESTQDNTLTSAEQAKVAQYLENGGKLFISGSELGWDLDRHHSNSELTDTLFYHQYLKSKYVYDGNSSMNRIFGVNATPFEGLYLSFGQTYPNNYPDDVDPVNGGEILMHYEYQRVDLTTFMNSVIGYRGNFGESFLPGGMVYAAFAVESMGSVSQMVELLRASREYLDIITSVNKDKLNVFPNEFSIIGNYPNPFNASTKINFYLPNESRVRIEIINILGQIVDSYSSVYPEGMNSFNWNAAEFSSGIYFTRITYKGIFKHHKMILLK